MFLHSRLSRALAGTLVFAGFAGVPAASSAALINRVGNGGFEMATFYGWTQIGESTYNVVYCPGPGLVPEGNCSAIFGPFGSLGGIQQSIATKPGATYTLTFDFIGDGGSPGNFTVDFGGDTVVDLVDAETATGGVRSFAFDVGAEGYNTLVRFQFRDDVGFLELDNVSVLAVPEPASLLLVGMALAGLAAGRKRGSPR